MASAPLPSTRPTLSRRSALAGAVAAALTPSAAGARALTPSPVPVGPLTLAQAEAVDFAAVWSSLSPAAQARIGALAIKAETFDQIGQDGGFHTTEGRPRHRGGLGERRPARSPAGRDLGGAARHAAHRLR